MRQVYNRALFQNWYVDRSIVSMGSLGNAILVCEGAEMLWNRIGRIARKVFRASKITANIKVRTQIKHCGDIITLPGAPKFPSIE